MEATWQYDLEVNLFFVRERVVVDMSARHVGLHGK